MDIVTASVRITGRVQGVAYRVWLRARARALGLTGWVRNNPDGSVSAVLQGEREAVKDMIKECWAGPGAAVVKDVQSEFTDTSERFDDFRITG